MDAATARSLFDSQAGTYDPVNTVISLGLDSRWRAWAASQAVARPHGRVLDAYCGTGLTGLIAAEHGAQVTFADVSPAMLAVAARRCEQRGLDAEFVLADLSGGDGLPEHAFEAMTLVFGVRYMDDAAATLRCLSRALVPGGRLVVVEFASPSVADRSLLHRTASAYFFTLLPRIASRLAGDRRLYDYLTSSSEAMTGERLESILHEAGMLVATRRTMGFGLVRGLVAVT